MWRLTYPSQRVTAPGENTEISVVGGESAFITYDSASKHLAWLRKSWPGLKADIQPVLIKDQGGVADTTLFARRNKPGNRHLRRK